MEEIGIQRRNKHKVWWCTNQVSPSWSVWFLNAFNKLIHSCSLFCLYILHILHSEFFHILREKNGKPAQNVGVHRQARECSIINFLPGDFFFPSFFHGNTIGNILLQYKNILKSHLLEAWFRIIKNILPYVVNCTCWKEAASSSSFRWYVGCVLYNSLNVCWRVHIFPYIPWNEICRDE